MAVGSGEGKSSKQCKVLKEKIVRKEKLILLLKELLQVKDKTTHESISQQLVTLRSKSQEANATLKKELFLTCNSTNKIVQQQELNRKTIEDLSSSLVEKRGTITHLEFQNKQLLVVQQQHEKTIETLKESIKTLEKKVGPSNCVLKPKKKKLKDKSLDDPPPTPASSVSSCPEISKAFPQPDLLTEGILTPASSVSSSIPVADGPSSPGIGWLDLDSRSNSPSASLSEVFDVTNDPVPPLLTPIQSATKKSALHSQPLPLLPEYDHHAEKSAVPMGSTNELKVTDLENKLKSEIGISKTIKQCLGTSSDSFNDLVKSDELMKMDRFDSNSKSSATVSIFDLPNEISETVNDCGSDTIDCGINENLMPKTHSELSWKHKSIESLHNDSDFSDSSDIDMELNCYSPDIVTKKTVSSEPGNRVSHPTDGIPTGKDEAEAVVDDNLRNDCLPGLFGGVRETNVSRDYSPDIDTKKTVSSEPGNRVSHPTDGIPTGKDEAEAVVDDNLRNDCLPDLFNGVRETNVSRNYSPDIDTKKTVSSEPGNRVSHPTDGIPTGKDEPEAIVDDNLRNDCLPDLFGGVCEINVSRDYLSDIVTKKTVSSEPGNRVSHPTDGIPTRKDEPEAVVDDNLRNDCLPDLFDGAREINVSRDSKSDIKSPTNINFCVSGCYVKPEVGLIGKLTTLDGLNSTTTGEHDELVENPTGKCLQGTSNSCVIDVSADRQTSTIESDIGPIHFSIPVDINGGVSADDSSPVRGKDLITESSVVFATSSPKAETSCSGSIIQHERVASTESNISQEGSTMSLRLTMSKNINPQKTTQRKTIRNAKELSNTVDEHPKISTCRTRQNSTPKTDLGSPVRRRSSRINASKSSSSSSPSKRLPIPSKDFEPHSVDNSTTRTLDSSEMSSESITPEPHSSSISPENAPFSTDSSAAGSKKPSKGKVRSNIFSQKQSTNDTVPKHTIADERFHQVDHSVENISPDSSFEAESSHRDSMDNKESLQPSLQDKDDLSVKTVADQTSLEPAIPDSLSSETNKYSIPYESAESDSSYPNSPSGGQSADVNENVYTINPKNHLNHVLSDFSSTEAISSGSEYRGVSCDPTTDNVRNPDLSNLRPKTVISPYFCGFDDTDTNPPKNASHCAKVSEAEKTMHSQNPPMNDSSLGQTIEKASSMDSNSASSSVPGIIHTSIPSLRDGSNILCTASAAIQSFSSPFSKSFDPSSTMFGGKNQTLPSFSDLKPDECRPPSKTNQYWQGGADFNSKDASYLIHRQHKKAVAHQNYDSPEADVDHLLIGQLCLSLNLLSMNPSPDNQNYNFFNHFTKFKKEKVSTVDERSSTFLPSRPQSFSIAGSQSSVSCSDPSKFTNYRDSAANLNESCDTSSEVTIEIKQEDTPFSLKLSVPAGKPLEPVLDSLCGMVREVQFKSAPFGFHRQVARSTGSGSGIPPRNQLSESSRYSPTGGIFQQPQFSACQTVLDSSVRCKSNDRFVSTNHKFKIENKMSSCKWANDVIKQPNFSPVVSPHLAGNSTFNASKSIKLHQTSVKLKTSRLGNEVSSENSNKGDNHSVAVIPPLPPQSIGSPVAPLKLCPVPSAVPSQRSGFGTLNGYSGPTESNHNSVAVGPFGSINRNQFPKTFSCAATIKPSTVDCQFTPISTLQRDKTTVQVDIRENAKRDDLDNRNPLVMNGSVVHSPEPQASDCEVSGVQINGFKQPKDKASVLPNKVSNKDSKAYSPSISFVSSGEVNVFPSPLFQNLNKSTSSSCESDGSSPEVVAKKRRMAHSPRNEVDKSEKSSSIILTEEQRSEVLRRQFLRKRSAVGSVKKTELDIVNPPTTSRMLRSSNVSLDLRGTTGTKPIKKKKQGTAHKTSPKKISAPQSTSIPAISIDQTLKPAGSADMKDDHMTCSQCLLKPAFCSCEIERIMREMIYFCPAPLSPIPDSPEYVSPFRLTDDETSDIEDLKDNAVSLSTNKKEISEPPCGPVDDSGTVETCNTQKDSSIRTKRKGRKNEVKIERRSEREKNDGATAVHVLQNNDCGVKRETSAEENVKDCVTPDNDAEVEKFNQVALERSAMTPAHETQLDSTNRVTSERDNDELSNRPDENIVKRRLRSSTSRCEVVGAPDTKPIASENITRRSRIARPKKGSSRDKSPGDGSSVSESNLLVEQDVGLVFSDSSGEYRTLQSGSLDSQVRSLKPIEEVVELNKASKVENLVESSGEDRVEEVSVKSTSVNQDDDLDIVKRDSNSQETVSVERNQTHRMGERVVSPSGIEISNLEKSVDKLLESIDTVSRSHLGQCRVELPDLLYKPQRVGSLTTQDPLSHLGKFFEKNSPVVESKDPSVDGTGTSTLRERPPSRSDDESEAEMVVDYSSCSEPETQEITQKRGETVISALPEESQEPSLSLVVEHNETTFNQSYSSSGSQYHVPSFYKDVEQSNNCGKNNELKCSSSDEIRSNQTPPASETTSQMQLPKFYTAINEVSDVAPQKEIEPKKLITISSDNKIFCKLISEEDVIPCSINVLAFASFYNLDDPKDQPFKFFESYKKYEERIENSLNEFFHHSDLKDSLKKAVSTLKNMKPNHVGKGLCAVVGQSNPKIQPYERTGIAPNFTRTQKKTAVLVSALAKGRLQYFNEVLNEIEAFLIPNPKTPSLTPPNAITNLSALYSLICRTQGLGLRVQSFIYDLLYGRHISAFGIINQILLVIPQAIPRARDIMGPLTFTIVYLIMKQGIYQSLTPRYLAQCGVTPLRMRLSTKYGYSLSPDITRDDVMEELMSNVMVKGCDKAIVLLSKSQGYRWTFASVQKHIFPILDKWISGEETDEDLVAHIIRLLGLVSRCFAISVCDSFVSMALGKIKQVIKQKTSLPMFEAVTEALVHFKRLNPEGVITILANWTPHDLKVTKSSVRTLKTITGDKPYSYWKQFMTS